MRIFAIIAVLLAIFAVVFAFQNAIPISLTFFGVNFALSLPIVLIWNLALGIIIGLLFAIPSIIKRNLQVAKYKSRIAELDNEANNHLETISHQRQRIENLEKHLGLNN